MDYARRNFLRGRALGASPPVRPPGATQVSITQSCTGCGACLTACPTGIVRKGAGDLPYIDFSRGECFFCDACAEACPEPVFVALPSQARFDHQISIGADCMPKAGVACQTCGDSCPEGAIVFRPRIGGPSIPSLDADLCTRCGACLSVCPVDAIAIVHDKRELSHA